MGYRVTLPLKDKSEREAEVTIDGTTAKVSIEESKVVIENVRAANADEAQTAARTIAAKLLDILCSMYEHCLVLGEADPASERIDQVRSALVEAEDGAKTCCVSDSSCTTVMVRFADPSSDSWRLGLLPYEHLPAMASYRSAMLTQNVFHKFRDLYLAIENAAARLHPGPESGPLLETALSTVYGSSLSALCNLAAKAGIACQPATAVVEVKKFLWKVHRLPLFHAAKDARVVSDPTDEAAVARARPLAEAVARDFIRAAAAKP